MNAPRSPWDPRDPHRGQPVATAGHPLAGAPAAVVMVHGRGATAENILTVADELGRPDLAYLAPQAHGSAWYPYSFLAPLEENEPGLSSGLAVLGDLLARVGAAGIPPERTVFLGFSQGACLATEFAARQASQGRRLGGSSGSPAVSSARPEPPGSIRDRSPALRSSSAAATATPTFRANGSTRRPGCSPGSAAR